MKHSNEGFTFLEILNVLIIVAVIGSMIVPAAGTFMSSARISAEAQIFLSDVRSGRYEAIRTGHVHRLVLDTLPAKNSYRVEQWEYGPEDDLGALTAASYADSHWNSILEEPTRDLSGEVSVSLASTKTIYFTPDGKLVESWSASSDGSPIPSRDIFFGLGNATMTVTLTAFGGFSSTDYFEE